MNPSFAIARAWAQAQAQPRSLVVSKQLDILHPTDPSEARPGQAKTGYTTRQSRLPGFLAPLLARRPAQCRVEDEAGLEEGRVWSNKASKAKQSKADDKSRQAWEEEEAIRCVGVEQSIASFASFDSFASFLPFPWQDSLSLSLSLSFNIYRPYHRHLFVVALPATHLDTRSLERQNGEGRVNRHSASHSSSYHSFIDSLTPSLVVGEAYTLWSRGGVGVVHIATHSISSLDASGASAGSMHRTLAVAIPTESWGSRDVDMDVASGATQADDCISPEAVGDRPEDYDNDEEDADSEEFFYDSREVLFEPFQLAPREYNTARGGHGSDGGGNDDNGPPTEMRDSSASDGEIESLCNRVVMEVVGSAQAYAAQREAEKQQEEEIEYLRSKCKALEKKLNDTESKLVSTQKEMKDRIQIEIDSSSRRNRNHTILNLCIGGISSLAVLYNWRRSRH